MVINPVVWGVMGEWVKGDGEISKHIKSDV